MQGNAEQQDGNMKQAHPYKMGIAIREPGFNITSVSHELSNPFNTTHDPLTFCTYLHTCRGTMCSANATNCYSCT